MSEMTWAAVRRKKVHDLADRTQAQFAQLLDDYGVDDNADAQKFAADFIDQLKDDLDDITGKDR